MPHLKPLLLVVRRRLELRVVEEVLIVAAPHDRLEVDDVGGRDGRGVHEGRGPGWEENQ